MKSQKTKVLLGFALIAIWGLLGFRISAKLSKDELPQQTASAIKVDPQAATSFEYTLDLAYRDPFGNKNKFSPTNNSQAPNPRRKPVKHSLISKSSPIVNFPKVEYRGDIITGTGRKAAVLFIEQEFINLGEGEFHDKLHLAKIYPDSILLSLDGASKIIVKEKG